MLFEKIDKDGWVFLTFAVPAFLLSFLLSYFPTFLLSCFPTFLPKMFAYDCPAYKELQELDMQRNKLRAKLSDLALEEESKKDHTPQWKKAQWEKRQSRRKWEAATGHWPTPPGPWDIDLDEFHEPSYSFDLGDGYTGTLKRNYEFAWNGYVKLPEGHPYYKCSYTMFEGYEAQDVPPPPMELTYGRGGEFGFDHGHSYDARPASVPCSFSYKPHNYFDLTQNGGAYVDFHTAKKEVLALGEYFKAAAKPKEAAAPKALPPKAVVAVAAAVGVKRSWADIVKPKQ